MFNNKTGPTKNYWQNMEPNMAQNVFKNAFEVLKSWNKTLF